MPGVGKSIKKDSQPSEVVFASKDGTRLRPLLCQPHCKSISIRRTSLAIDSEFKINLKGRGSDGQPRPKPSLLMRSVLRETDMTIRVDDGIPTKVPELVLKGRLYIRCVDGVSSERDDCIAAKVEICGFCAF